MNANKRLHIYQLIKISSQQDSPDYLAVKVDKQHWIIKTKKALSYI
jgi:hypothetical protein